jgi:hypothetical protein
MDTPSITPEGAARSAARPMTTVSSPWGSKPASDSRSVRSARSWPYVFHSTDSPRCAKKSRVLPMRASKSSTLSASRSRANPNPRMGVVTRSRGRPTRGPTRSASGSRWCHAPAHRGRPRGSKGEHVSLGVMHRMLPCTGLQVGRQHAQRPQSNRGGRPSTLAGLQTTCPTTSLLINATMPADRVLANGVLPYRWRNDDRTHRSKASVSDPPIPHRTRTCNQR